MFVLIYGECLSKQAATPTILNKYFCGWHAEQKELILQKKQRLNLSSFTPFTCFFAWWRMNAPPPAPLRRSFDFSVSFRRERKRAGSGR